jgi:hypothetical protein
LIGLCGAMIVVRKTTGAIVFSVCDGLCLLKTSSTRKSTVLSRVLSRSW